MARNSFNRIQSAPMRRRSLNPLVPLALLLVLIAGALYYLSSKAKFQPLQPIEVDVARDAPAK